ncbi:MAG: DNA adenine methylase [Lachnospiraceae bacterium]|nr:DNA adenine methylase [Lachnospiraceae bacterium]
MFYSPLRYPGGKGKLAEFMKYMIDQLGHSGGTYIEPFAGGAGIAIELLLRGVVSRIVINDYDKGIWSFWKAVLTETDRFIEELAVVPLTMEEWCRQRDICLMRNDKYSFELGFAIFYMNRTNRSGIIKGGVIGGMDQAGLWKMDARFNREELSRRIESIAERKSDIKLYNKDINSFITRYIPLYEENTLVYFDPPYFKKGKQLYMNYFQLEDHVRIERTIRNHVKCDWIITYDNAPEIECIYKDYSLCLYDLDYSVSSKCKASEFMIFKNGIVAPRNEELQKQRIKINIRLCNSEGGCGSENVFPK